MGLERVMEMSGHGFMEQIYGLSIKRVLVLIKTHCYKLKNVKYPFSLLLSSSQKFRPETYSGTVVGGSATVPEFRNSTESKIIYIFKHPFVHTIRKST
jgi:hypothetical protein